MAKKKKFEKIRTLGIDNSDIESGEIYNLHGYVSDKGDFARFYVALREIYEEKYGECKGLFITYEDPEKLKRIGVKENEIVYFPSVWDGYIMKDSPRYFDIIAIDNFDVQKAKTTDNDHTLMETLFVLKDEIRRKDDKKHPQSFMIIYVNPDIFSPEYKAIFQENVRYLKNDESKPKKNLSIKLG